MKIRNMNYKTMSIALVLALSLSVSSVALATDKHKSKSAPASELKLIGQVGNFPVLELKFTNTDEDVFTISVRDTNGNELYSTRVKGTSFDKKFIINTDEIGDETLKIEVRSKNGNSSEVYTVSRNETSVHETVVTKN